jgi:hypothetical protein
MPETSLDLSSLLELPGKGFAQQVLTAGLTNDELNSLRNQISSALKGMPWPHVEETICARLSELLKKDPMELIATAWDKYHVLADAAEQSRSGETVLVALEEHSITSELHPYVEIRFGPNLIRRIEFDVTVNLRLKGVILKIESQRIKAVEAGSCEGSGEIQVKNVSIWKHDFTSIDLPGRINLGSGIPVQ